MFCFNIFIEKVLFYALPVVLGLRQLPATGYQPLKYEIRVVLDLYIPELSHVAFTIRRDDILFAIRVIHEQIADKAVLFFGRLCNRAYQIHGGGPNKFIVTFPIPPHVNGIPCLANVLETESVTTTRVASLDCCRRYRLKAER